MSTLNVQRAASFWYPVMLTQEQGLLSEARAAELLGIDVLAYRTHKELTVKAVLTLAQLSTSPLRSVLEVMKAKPELFE